jgi:hypothetical protein
VALNPAIVETKGGAISDREGCLSFPGLYQNVRRFKTVVVRYYDLKGTPVKFRPVSDHVIAVTLEDLRHIPMVVCVTSGRVKGPGLCGALRGGHLDVLICDESAARAALALDKATPRPGEEGLS